MANGLADHDPPRCAMQLGLMLRLDGVEGNGKPSGTDGTMRLVSSLEIQVVQLHASHCDHKR